MSGPTSLRNVALIAHVDHGKTTLVDAMLNAAGVFAAHETRVDRVLDSSDQERERGITILAKAASIVWKDTKINLVDTPGHSDFGGEVERALTMVDGVLLLVDAAEGPMPQTRYVLSKALARGLGAVVVINKVDRPDARTSEVADEVYQLFFDLDAEDRHIEFPIISAVARLGRAVAGVGIPDEDSDLAPILDAVVENVPPPSGDPDGPLQAIVTNLDASDYLGRLAIGRVASGTLHVGRQVGLVRADGSLVKRRLVSLLGFSGLGRDDVAARAAGDLFVVSGYPEVEIGDTLTDAEDPRPLPRIEVDEPVLRMTFGVNTSPLAGRAGTQLTSRQIRARLEREILGNVSIRITETSSPDVIEVAGRGELQLAVLIESMRREGFELQVSRPEVVLRSDGSRPPKEPRERARVDVPDEYVGTVTQALAPRRGQVEDMRPGDRGRTIIAALAPARGLLGFRSELMTATRGTALVNQHFDGWMDWAGEIEGRVGGAIISDRSGVATGFALDNLQKRGEMFIGPGDVVYEGMVVGENSRPEEMIANPAKPKQLTNIRAAGSDEAIKLKPPRRLSLESAIEWIDDDELVEVTPDAIRVRKLHRGEAERRLARKRLGS